MRNLATTVFFSCAIGVIVLVSSIATYYYLKNRYVQPIRSRLPVVSASCVLFLTLLSVSLSLEQIIWEDFPCAIHLFVTHNGVGFVMNCFLLRCWSLYFAFNLTRERTSLVDRRPLNNFASRSPTPAGMTPRNAVVARIEVLPVSALAQAGRSGSSAPSWFVGKVYMVRPPFLTAVFLVMTVLQLIPPILVLGVVPSTRTSAYSNCDLVLSDLLLASYSIVYIVTVMTIAWVLSGMLDGLFIKKELKICAGLAATAVMSFGLGLLDPVQEVHRRYIPVVVILEILAFTIMSLVITLYPLSKISASSEASDSSQPPNANSEDVNQFRFDSPNMLAKFLKIEPAFLSFKEFLTKEFSVENLMFWRDVEAYRSRFSVLLEPDEEVDLNLKSMMAKEATRLFSMYISTNAPLELNLPSSALRPLKAMFYENADASRSASPAAIQPYAEDNDTPNIMPQVELITPLVFDEAQQQVLILMARDSLQRYHRSAMFEQLREQLSHQNEQQEVLRNLNAL